MWCLCHPEERSDEGSPVTSELYQSLASVGRSFAALLKSFSFHLPVAPRDIGAWETQDDILAAFLGTSKGQSLGSRQGRTFPLPYVRAFAAEAAKVVALNRSWEPARFPEADDRAYLAEIAGRDDVLLVTADITEDRKSTRLNSSHIQKSRMPSSA